ncbi:MAG TPA: AbrB/MazE/SpoVT family DNA-binding domain-containing protein [Gaiellales bacterium]|nr:AbrB/MazE/SpoVT family DNA-binding domain-containing protein [Gaiellales bacterium]
MISGGDSRRANSATRAGGVVRRVDELGRIVIPVEIRRKLRIGEHDPLEITTNGRTIVLAKPRDACALCGSRHDLTPFRENQICASCRSALADGEVSAR